MKNTMANIMISYIEDTLAKQESFEPLIIAICTDSKIEENEVWKSFTHQMRKDTVSMVVKHFQNKGFDVSSLSHNDQFKFKRNYTEIYSPEGARGLQFAAVRQKNLVDIPNTINETIQYINAEIKKEANLGHEYALIDLTANEKNMKPSLSRLDRTNIFSFIWASFKEAGYYVRETSRGIAQIIWDTEKIAYYSKQEEEQKVIASTPKKKHFWNRK